MKLQAANELDDFRAEVQQFVAANAPPMRTRVGSRAPESESELAMLREWGAKLFAHNYLGGDWPIEWGGLGADHDPMRAVVVAEEIALADAPKPLGVNSLAAHAFLSYGTADQKYHFLPRMRAYDHVWCQLFSEPNAGSDLASLRTSARLEGDVYVVDGFKVWSTYSAWSDFGLLLARTHPEEPLHHGITAFALDMSTPGITINPLREITGTSDFSEVILDSVRVPASAVIGTPGEGWSVASSTLAAERSGTADVGIRVRRNIVDLVQLAKRRGNGGNRAADDAGARRAIARFYAHARASNLLMHLTRSRQRRGVGTASDSAVEKLFVSELYVELAEHALTAFGTSGLLVGPDPRAIDDGHWQDMFLYSRAYTISGGSSEIMRNVIAERGLGMPREPRGWPLRPDS